MELGFVGLGHMGRAIALSLQRAGHAVHVFNRTREKADELAKEGIRVASSPSEAASRAEVVLTMVADDDALESVVLGDRGVIAGLRGGCVHVSMSTISVELSRRLAEAHRDAGQHYVAAPVLGRPEAAEQGTLVVLAAGPSDALARCRPLFDVIGQRTHEISERPERANAVKLGVNLVLAAMIETLGEAFALVEGYGVEASAFLEIVNGSLMRSPVIESYGRRIAERSFEPGFALRLGLKDLRLTIDAGEAVAVSLPVGGLVRERLVDAIALGLGDADWSAVARARPHP